eukprot:3849749-Lingulodinium_polyedra.AAC.1
MRPCHCLNFPPWLHVLRKCPPDEHEEILITQCFELLQNLAVDPVQEVLGDVLRPVLVVLQEVLANNIRRART